MAPGRVGRCRHRYVDLVIVADEDIDIHTWNDVGYAPALYFNAADDLHLPHSQRP